MIEMRNVGFIYGNGADEPGQDTGVENLNLSVKHGECVVLCGRSGCGKSTILRLVNGLAPGFYAGRLTGEVSVAGKTVSSLLPEERTRLMGVVFQDPRSQFFMSNVWDELAFTAENLGISPDEIKASIQHIAQATDITHLLDRSLNMLSSGQKQKVAIAAAALLAPPLLILDEPTANLDGQSTGGLLKILKRLKDRGTTLIISEHRLHAFLPVADRYVYMEKGRLQKMWTKEEFMRLTYEDVQPFGLRHPDMAEKEAFGQAAHFNHKNAYEGKELTYHYRKTGDGIQDINITLPVGSVTALMGENGTGKTTLCRILCGLQKQQKGEILYKGATLSPSKRREMSCLVMQDADYQLYADSVGNEVVLGRQMDDALRQRAYEALDAFGLREFRDRHPASLSGGEKQRVTMAAAYLSDADFIVLDEPTSGLDGDGVLKVAAWVRKLAQTGKSVIIITHDKILANLACNQVVELRNESKEVKISER